ncbi:hypothetical protein [Robiginitalea sp.]|uniref:hypothetical protein n=1 Tax=Robiginitalea sp. TaxID=1902411 RepID=UPI003C5BC448
MENVELELSFSGPAIYRITIKGEIPDTYIGRFGHMNFKVFRVENARPETILEGRISDQAELSGVLKSIYNLRLPIKEVTLLED